MWYCLNVYKFLTFGNKILKESDKHIFLNIGVKQVRAILKNLVQSKYTETIQNQWIIFPELKKKHVHQIVDII